MSRFLALSLIIVISLSGGCSSQGESQLSKTLSGAVKDKKLSEKKKAIILEEYDMLRARDKEEARKYVADIVSAVEMGADSSHLDVVRKRAGGAGK